MFCKEIRAIRKKTWGFRAEERSRVLTTSPELINSIIGKTNSNCMEKGLDYIAYGQHNLFNTLKFSLPFPNRETE